MKKNTLLEKLEEEVKFLENEIFYQQTLFAKKFVGQYIQTPNYIGKIVKWDETLEHASGFALFADAFDLIDRFFFVYEFDDHSTKIITEKQFLREYKKRQNLRQTNQEKMLKKMGITL